MSAEAAPAGLSNKEEEAQQEVASEVEGSPAEEQNRNGYPVPIPEDWKEGREKRVEDWFAEAVNSTKKKYDKDQAKLVAYKSATEDAQATLNANKMTVAAFMEAAKKLRVQQEERIKAGVAAAMKSNSDQTNHALMFPHYTAVRPIVVLSDPGAGFKERLFVRSLVSTMVANCKPDSTSSSSSASSVGMAYGQELLWWDKLQPRIAMRDANLSRLEATRDCQVAILVLSQGFVTRPEFPAERDLIASRLRTANPDGSPTMRLVVLRFSDDPLRSPPTFPEPSFPTSHPLLPGSASLNGVPLVVQVEVQVAQHTPQQQVEKVLSRMNSVLSVSASVRLEDEPEFFYHPIRALDYLLFGKSPMATQRLTASTTGAPAFESVDLGSTASGNALTSLRIGPAVTPTDTGASWAAAHQLPFPLGLSKPLEDWSVHDVQVWMRSLGSCFDRYCWGFKRLSVDGWMLSVLTEDDLSHALCVDDARSRTVIMNMLKSALEKTWQTQSIANLPPQNGECPELFSLPEDQLKQVLKDVFMYYDVDRSNDLNQAEAASLLAAAGCADDDTLSQVFEGYDADEDGRLNFTEAAALLRDMWRMFVASRDVSSWNLKPHFDESFAATGVNTYNNCSGAMSLGNMIAGEASFVAAEAAKSLRPSPIPPSETPSMHSNQGPSHKVSFVQGVKNPFTRETEESHGEGDARAARVSFIAGESSPAPKAAGKPLKLQQAPSAGASKAPMPHTRGYGAGHTLGSAWGGAMSSRGGWPHDDCMSVATTMVDANLDAYDASVWGANKTTLRGMSDTKEMRLVLKNAVEKIDFRRSGFMDAATLRSMLTFGLTDRETTPIDPLGPSNTSETTDTLPVSPLELWLLSVKVEELARKGIQPLAVDDHLLSSSLALISGQHFVEAAVSAVASSQEDLMDSVYSEAGTKTLLMRLHTQIHPPHDPSIIQDGPESAASKLVNREEAVKLLGFVTDKLQIQLPAFVQTGILKEAHHVACSLAAAGGEVSMWSSAVAHMVHVYKILCRARGR